MADNQITTEIVYQVDTASVEQAKKSANDVAKAVSNAQKQVTASAPSGSGSMGGGAKSGGASSVAKESRDIAEASGSASSGLSKLGSAIGALGGGSAVSDIGDIVGSLESLKDIKGVASSLGSNLTSVVGAGALAGGAILAVSLAFKKFTDDAEAQAKQINSIVEARRSVASEIVGGLTTAEAQEKIALAQKTAEAERVLLKNLQDRYKSFEEQSGVLAGGFKAISAQEEEWVSQIDKSKAIIDGANSSVMAYNKALADGTTANNDAKEKAEEAKKAEEDLAKEREATAGKVIALNESYQKELIQFSEQSKEQELSIVQKRNDAIKDANKEFLNSVQDVRTGLKRATQDINESLNRDLSDLATDFFRQQADAIESIRNDESRAYREHQRNLRDIRENAYYDEQEAIRNRDALALAQIREQAQRELNQTDRTYGEGALDAREQANQELKDQQRAYDRQRQDRLNGYQRELQDARIASQRELEDARLAKQRALQTARDAYVSELSMLKQKLESEYALKKQLFERELALLSQVANNVTTNNVNMQFTSQANTAQIQQTVLATLKSVGIA